MTNHPCPCGDDFQIVQYTTPTFEVRFRTVDTANVVAADLVFKVAGVTVLTKPFSDAYVQEKTLSWTLEQAESGSLPLNKTVRVYCDWVLTDGTRGRSRAADYQVVEAGTSEVM